MKKIFLLLVFILLPFFASAHDIEVQNGDGVTIYYKWINDSTELSVSYRTESNGYGEYTGNVVIPESVTYNGVTYSVTAIGNDAFKSCSSLLSVTIPRSVVSISPGIFAFSNNLTSVIVDPRNPKYDSRDNCNAIIETATDMIIVGCKNTNIPSNIIGIGKYAFEGCLGLTSLTIPANVTSIGEYAFEGCSDLTSLTIPASVTSIGKGIFGSCSNLSSIVVEPENAKYDSRYNCNAIIETEKNMLIACCKNSTIPNSVTSIGEYAYYNCSGLISIEIPDNIIAIGENAFRKCGELLSVKIGNGVSIIENSTFRSCKELKTISFGTNVQEIKSGAISGCNYLETIISLNTVPPTLAQGVFSSSEWRTKSFNLIIQVPSGCLEVYKNADVWKRFSYLIEGDFSNPCSIIDSYNFPDEKFREYLMNEPYGKDRVLTEEEIASITTLNVSNLGISDLKGIEYFTALKKLLCYKNNLTALKLSANRQLKEVDCYCNQIMGIKMDSLLASLPTLDEGEGSLYVFDATEDSNICFAEQVSYAKSKGWIVYHYTGSDWLEYEGHESGILISEENFPDEKFREYLMKWKLGKDMIITDDEIKTITSINLNAYNYSYDRADGEITSLKGIEHFAFLQSLQCDGNKLTSLDISKNSLITTLSCRYNYSLTEIDVSNNTELTELSCGGRFARLDVSNNTKLVTLYCSSNLLTELDVSNNTALTSLSLSSTGLKNLDISKNTALTSLSLQFNRSLSNIDISKNKALTRLYCPDNKFTDIDVSKNTALTYLYCPYNQLTSLDVSKNRELTELACMGNQLTQLDVSKNLKLKYLKCQQNKINGEGMYQLIESLPNQESATLCVINLQKADENVCTKDQVKKANEKGWKVMWGYEYYNSGPAGYHPYYNDYEGSDSEDIYIEEDTFPDSGFRAFLLEQSYGKDGVITEEEIGTITSINVSYGGISSLRGIEHFTALEKLNCSWGGLESLDVTKNTALAYLNCGQNQLTSLDVSKNTALTELYCYGNNLSELNISNNTSLTTLNCGNNKLKKLDVSKNTELTSLNCSVNELTEFDVTNNTSLKVLNCYENKLTYLDVSNNTKLNELFCYVNALTNLDLSKNTALTNLSCSDNQLESLDVTNNEELIALSCKGNLLTDLAVANNRKLTSLDCARNRITKLDITTNNQLSSLACYSNKIKDSDMDALIDGLPINNNAILYVICTGDNLEENICNTSQVDKAKQKGWRVMNGGDTYIYTYHAYNVGFSEYDGSDPSGIQGITSEQNANAPIYDVCGRRLKAPRKGLNIIGGKKVVIQ